MPAKFKIGDRVRLTSEMQQQFARSPIDDTVGKIIDNCIQDPVGWVEVKFPTFRLLELNPGWLTRVP